MPFSFSTRTATAPGGDNLADSRRTPHLLSVLCLLVASACGDEDVTDPVPDPTLTVSPVVQWAGGEVEISGEALADADAVVQIDGEPTDVTARDGSSVIARLPNPHLSGVVDVEALVAGQRVASGSVEIVGSAHPVRRATQPLDGCASCIAVLPSEGAFHFHGVAAGSGRFLAAMALSRGIGLGIVSLESDPLVVNEVAELATGDYEFPGLAAPAPTAEPRRWAIDLSLPEEPARPVILETSGGPTAVGTLDCVGDGVLGQYVIAELAGGDCLVLSYNGFGESGSLALNGETPVPGYANVPAGRTAGCVTFESSPDARWSTVQRVVEVLSDGCFASSGTASPPPAWPVFDAGGSVVFDSDRYPTWPTGASFSASGDTLWTVGETASGWSLDAWSLSSSMMVEEVALPGYDNCGAVLTDPLLPRVYASCQHEDDPFSWPVLIVYGVEEQRIVARLETVLDGNSLTPMSPWKLVYGGSSGRVHLVAVWDGTTAPVERGLMVASYDTRF